MSSPEFMDFGVAMRHVCDPAFEGDITFAVEGAGRQDSAIINLEERIAQRFDVDKDESGLQLLKFAVGSTWKKVTADYRRNEKSDPEDLFVTVAADQATVVAGLLVPFTRRPNVGKALIVEYAYRPRIAEHSRSYRTSLKLTRNHAGSAVIKNPFADARPEPTPSDHRFADRVRERTNWRGKV